MHFLRHRLFGITLAASFLLVAGCASSGETVSDIPEGTTPITIENYHAAAEDLQIYIQRSGSASRDRLGAVPRGETETFSFDGETGEYRLIADMPVSSMDSEAFSIRHETVITWNIQNDRIITSRR